MTAQPLSPAEQATVDRFDAAEPAPESWPGGHTYCGNCEGVDPATCINSGPVTARPVGDGDGQDGLREELALALPHDRGCLALYPPASTTIATTGPCTCWHWRMAVADALLPVVTAWAERRARERAAEELRAAAEGQRDRHGWLVGFPLELLARADALAADDRTGQR